MNSNNSTTHMPIFERPYEKFNRLGVHALSDEELLAVILRTGSSKEDALHLAYRILHSNKEYCGLLTLNHLTLEELKKLHGIGQVKATQLLCMSEITRRMAKATRKDGIHLSSPDSVASYYMEDMRHLTTEQIMLVLLDSKSKILDEQIISRGTVNASLLTPREIFIYALKHGAVNIILLHNHPSGDPSPSAEDLVATKRVREAGVLIGIRLMDHLIIGDNRYISLKEQGLL